MDGWAKSLKWLTVGVGFMTATMVASAQEQLTEGKDFLRLKAPQTVESGAKIEVIEFYSYGCNHCRDLEEFLGPWTKKVPADVAFKRVPVAFQAAWGNLGKIYYTLEALGREDLTPKIFLAIHGGGVKLNEEKVFFDWAGNNGLDAKKVEEMWSSFAIDSKMKRAKTLAAPTFAPSPENRSKISPSPANSIKSAEGRSCNPHRPLLPGGYGEPDRKEGARRTSA